MKGQWTIRPLIEKDEAEVIELLRSVGFGTSTKEMWKWKFKDDPFGFIGTVGVSDDRVVGHMSLMLVDMQIGYTIVRGAQAASLAVAPKFRREGMFIEIGKALMKDAADKNIPLVYGIPNEPAFRGHLKYGWFLVGAIPVLSKFLSRKTLARFLWRRLFWIRTFMKRPFLFLKTWFGWFGYLFSRSKWRRIKPIEEAKIRELTLFDSGVDHLWKRISGNYSAAIVRSHKYLNWRYFGQTASPYKVFAVNANGSLEGYLVLSVPTSTDPNNEAHIVDLLASSNDVTESLLAFAVDYCKKKERG